MKKINVLFIGAHLAGFNRKWGGTLATNYAFFKSFENSDRFNIIHVDRRTIRDTKTLQHALKSHKYDIVHIDDTRLMEIFFNARIQPDVIGPVTRSPIKTYGGKWKAPYTPEFFYKSVIIRLNRSEEYIKNGEIDYTDKIEYVNHGIDTDLLVPVEAEKKYVLWAGDSKRYAKNYELWQEIINGFKLPDGYEFKTMGNYVVQDYWKALDNTKILVNTSRYESFCNALFEAKSKGVPSIYKHNLHNSRHEDGRVQVDYTVDGYREEIIKMLTDEEYYATEAILSREYTVDNFSLKRMEETYSDAYDIALRKKI